MGKEFQSFHKPQTSQYTIKKMDQKKNNLSAPRQRGCFFSDPFFLLCTDWFGVCENSGTPSPYFFSGARWSRLLASAAFAQLTTTAVRIILPGSFFLLTLHGFFTFQRWWWPWLVRDFFPLSEGGRTEQTLAPQVREFFERRRVSFSLTLAPQCAAVVDAIGAINARQSH